MLSVHQLSTGPVALLAFHGIGQDHRCFEPLARAVEGRYALFAFDLFFHGEPPVQFMGEVLTKTAWRQYIQNFLDQYRIERFAVIGFSMGGRFALATAQLFPKQTAELILLAPDGITVSPWYRLATGSTFGRMLFRFFLRHLPTFHVAGEFLQNLRLVDKSVLRFAESTLASPIQRERVYRSWIGFRKLFFKPERLGKTLTLHPIRVRFFLGYYDRVLPADYILPLTHRLYAYELTVLKTGHNRLIEKVAEVL
ncbi:alpha/beta hydrolase [Larkinella soli]|uniref:alpha/beta hydrolase n=1 Tax=Larkinella soli TaxID=1770527 RepID=UPI000FFCBD9D|nr:alpha/beta hydrolase [Larkinella soli]